MSGSAWSPAWLSAQLRAATPPSGIGLAQVYRNTTWLAWIEALVSQFPSISGLMGDEWAHAAAREYIRLHPPDSAVLIDIGETYPSFLAAFEHASQWPWLGDVAQCDWLWSRAYVAADAQTLTRQSWQNAISNPHCSRLQLHPSCNWHWCDGAPIAQLWHDAKQRTSNTAPNWHGEGLLLTRPSSEVLSCGISAPELAFINALAIGGTLQEAVETALSNNDASETGALNTVSSAHTPPPLNLARLSAKLLRMGAFMDPIYHADQ
jgi:hypothetical protein